ncbi:hypothetical protein PIROE2DRAFT_14781 [Piromyces sp. E2]|nr:hypothetical protein PIROE2DRAFT_14781 [Piromyces sp. E2]|eukprot:OUM59634.1 hypothetical protein PIROE2DRAFT_14781 [Piromyces sp. E2]
MAYHTTNTWNFFQIPGIGSAITDFVEAVGDTIVDVSETLFEWLFKRNLKNQWYIKNNNNNYYIIISVYDNNCLTYDNLNIIKCDKCNNNNNNIDYRINDGIVCFRINKNKCING